MKIIKPFGFFQYFSMLLIVLQTFNSVLIGVFLCEICSHFKNWHLKTKLNLPESFNVTWLNKKQTLLSGLLCCLTNMSGRPKLCKYSLTGHPYKKDFFFISKLSLINIFWSRKQKNFLLAPYCKVCYFINYLRL